MKHAFEILGSLLLGVVVIWLFYAMTPKTDCERITRLSKPVAVVGEFIRAMSEGWTKPADRVDMYLMQNSAEDAARRLIARQFFQGIQCK